MVLSGSTLYGDVGSGGSGASGTSVKIDTNARFRHAAYFSRDGSGTNNDGAHPKADLMLSGAR